MLDRGEPICRIMQFEAIGMSGYIMVFWCEAPEKRCKDNYGTCGWYELYWGEEN